MSLFTVYTSSSLDFSVFHSLSQQTETGILFPSVHCLFRAPPPKQLQASPNSVWAPAFTVLLEVFASYRFRTSSFWSFKVLLNLSRQTETGFLLPLFPHCLGPPLYRQLQASPNFFGHLSLLFYERFWQYSLSIPPVFGYLSVYSLSRQALRSLQACRLSLILLSLSLF